MIVVHHLNNSRSQRVLWLLEELGAPYEVKRYERNAHNMLAPPELRAIHPLGKSPVIEDTATGELVAETGATCAVVSADGVPRPVMVPAAAMTASPHQTYELPIT